MAKRIFTDESLTTLVNKTKAYVDTAVSGKAATSHTHAIDSSLSSTSTNPVQNKVVQAAIQQLSDSKADKDEIGAFYVDFTDTLNGSFSSNRTFEEIYEAYNNDYSIIATINDFIMLPLLMFDNNDGFTFHTSLVEEGTMGSIAVTISPSNIVGTYMDTLTAEGIGALPADTFIPTKVSELTNDSNFVTSSVLNALNDEFDDHVGNVTSHTSSDEKTKWNSAYSHSTATHARTDATKVAKSNTNGNILINGTETVVYTHPTGTNPHGTTKADVGLGNVDNTSDANKPVSTAQQNAINAVQNNVNTLNDEFDDHVADATAHMTSTQKTQLSTAYSHSQAAHLQTEDSVTSTSTTSAATPNSVKKAYDLASTANTNATQAKTAVTTHNTATDAHNDIRLLISELSTQVNNFLDVDDTTKDELSEIIALIEANADSIEDITSGKVNVTDIINNLTTNVSNKPLSAAQGVAIKALIDALQKAVDNIVDGTTTVAKATNASSASYATNASTSTYAVNASTADYAKSANKATTASKAGTATRATNADTSTYAINAGTATYATNSGTATYATNSGTATYATKAGTATHADKATTATNAGTANYAKNAGTANTLKNLTASVTELNYMDGVTSNVQTQLDKNYSKVISRGEQLVVNGNGLMGDNTNFSSWTFDGAVANNSPGSFTKDAGSTGTLTTNEFFPVNPEKEYTFSLDAKSAKGVGKLYSMLTFFDADKNEIVAGNHIHNAASTTTLAKELKSGDTVIYLTSSTGWSTSFSYGFYMIVWNYTNSFGYTYPSGTYSRTRLTLPKNGNYLNSAKLNTTNHTITLDSAYTGATIPAGTSVSQGGDGGTYKYFPLSNTTIPATWTTYSGKISGIDYSGGNKGNMFPPGTAYAKVGFLWNYQGSGNGEQQWITNLSITDTTSVSAAANNSITGLSVSGKTITYTKGSGTTGTITTQDTVYTHPSSHAASMITGLSTVATSGNYNDLSNKPSIPTVYKEAQCTTFTSDEGTCTPAAVRKATTMFAVPKVTSTDKAITRFNGTSGAVQNSKIIIEDVTNTKDSSKKAQVIAIPAEGGKKMVYGYCTDQVDGTSFIGGVFASTATSYPYNEGLAIGGTSGNLLWKGKRVLDNDDLTTLNSSIGGKASSSHTHNYAGSTSAGGAATRAINADTATYATSAGSATNASTATYATNAGTASYSSNGAKATSATSATYASTATKAGTATRATNADTATYATKATTATYLNGSTGIAKYFRVYDSNSNTVGSFYTSTAGSTANTGTAYLTIGNGSATSVAGNARGYLRLYDATTAYTELRTSGSNGANRTVIMPNASGTMAYLNHLGRSSACTAANTSYGTYMARAIAAGTGALTAGSTTMTNGTIYFQYE